MRGQQPPFPVVLDLTIARDRIEIVSPTQPIGQYKIAQITAGADVRLHFGTSGGGIPQNAQDGASFPNAWTDGFYVTNAAQAGLTCTIAFVPAPRA